MAYQQSPQSKDSFAICFAVVALDSTTGETFFKSKSSKNSKIRSDIFSLNKSWFLFRNWIYSERFGDSEQDYLYPTWRSHLRGDQSNTLPSLTTLYVTNVGNIRRRILQQLFERSSTMNITHRTHFQKLKYWFQVQNWFSLIHPVVSQFLITGVWFVFFLCFLQMISLFFRSHTLSQLMDNSTLVSSSLPCYFHNLSV